MNSEAIAARDREIEKLEEELTTSKTNEKKARAALLAFEAKPRLSDLRHDIQQLETERSAIQARLTSHQGVDEVSLPPQEREELERKWKQWQSHATLRRRICREVWGKCTEVLPENMTSKELWVCINPWPYESDYLSCAYMACRSHWGLKEPSNERRSGIDALLMITSSPLQSLGDLRLGLSGSFLILPPDRVAPFFPALRGIGCEE